MVSEQDVSKSLHSRVFKWEQKWTTTAGKLRVFKWTKMVLGDQLVDEFSEDEEIIIETRPTTPEQQQPEQEIPLSVLAAESMLEDVPSSPGIEKVDPNTRPQDFNEMDADIEEAEMERRMETDEQRERLEAEQDDVITREAENHARSFPVSNQDSLSSLAANNPTDS